MEHIASIDFNSVTNPRTLPLEHQLEILKFCPATLSGAFASQAKNLTKATVKIKRIACYLEVIAAHYFNEISSCYRNAQSLNKMFNDRAEKYGIKEVKKTTFNEIQNSAIEAGLAIKPKNLISFDLLKMKKTRTIILNFDAIAATFPSVFNTAIRYAYPSFLSRFRSIVGKQSKNNAEASNSKGLQEHQEQEKRSKSLNKRSLNKNKGVCQKFYSSYFKEDAREVQSLQEQANNAKQYEAQYRHIHFSGYKAKRLINLHKKHGVKLGESFLKFLKYTIHSTEQARQKKAEKARVARAEQATKEQRDADLKRWKSAGTAKKETIKSEQLQRFDVSSLRSELFGNNDHEVNKTEINEVEQRLINNLIYIKQHGNDPIIAKSRGLDVQELETLYQKYNL